MTRTEEQQELANTVRALLAKRSDSAAVRRAMASETGYDAGLWEALCQQIGVAALVVPEEYDGVGASLAETAVVLEELGANLAPAPLLASTLAAANTLLHGTDDDRRELLPRLAAGEVVPFALGRVVLEPEERAASMDQTLRLAVRDEPAIVPDDVRDLAVVLVSALQVGAMQRALDMTVAYSLERVQFGRQIGSFQALKHRMADMLVLVEASRSANGGAVEAAAAYLADPTIERAAELARLAAVVGRYCTDALAQVASEMVQLHGGIAITWEHDAHLVFKRAHALAQLVRAATRTSAGTSALASPAHDSAGVPVGP